MILSYVHNISSSYNLISSAYKLSKLLGKSFGVLSFAKSIEDVELNTKNLSDYCENLSINTDFISVQVASFNDMVDICEKIDVSFLMMQLIENKSKKTQKLLTSCRNLRIPYLIFKDEFSELKLDKVILPVNFLEEEVEKAQFASAFGRFCNSEIQLLLANDAGSKAQINAERIIEFFNKFNFSFQLIKANKDSFSVDNESIKLANDNGAGLIIVTASRDYGLDDIIFGPKELHLIKKSNVPILLVNPRGDLYALCD